MGESFLLLSTVFQSTAYSKLHWCCYVSIAEHNISLIEITLLKWTQQFGCNLLRKPPQCCFSALRGKKKTIRRCCCFCDRLFVFYLQKNIVFRKKKTKKSYSVRRLHKQHPEKTIQSCLCWFWIHLCQEEASRDLIYGSEVWCSLTHIHVLGSDAQRMWVLFVSSAHLLASSHLPAPLWLHDIKLRVDDICGKSR